MDHLRHPGTRGHGLAESFLAARRRQIVKRLLPPCQTEHHVLDVGSGSPPVFLLSLSCQHRTGLDTAFTAAETASLEPLGICAVSHDLHQDTPLPFPDRHFDLITMMAVLEHLEPLRAPALLADLNRLLKPGGMLVLTTPAAWTAPVLEALARLRLVSRVEIDDHKAQYDRRTLRALLAGARFTPASIRAGCFLCGANLWACARA